MQVERQTEVQKDRCTNINTDKKNKDVQTYTDKQTDRRTVPKCWKRLKNRQMFRKTYLQYCTEDRHTHRQTDKKERKE